MSCSHTSLSPPHAGLLHLLFWLHRLEHHMCGAVSQHEATLLLADYHLSLTCSRLFPTLFIVLLISCIPLWLLQLCTSRLSLRSTSTASALLRHLLILQDCVEQSG